MAKIIAYMRRSKDDETGLSFAAQLDAISKHQGSTDAVYKDEGISGARADRPGLLAALDALRRGDVLAVYRRDRLARDVYLAAWIDKEVQKRGARIVSATETGTKGQDPASELLRHIVSAFAAHERALVGARTRAALAQKRERGEKLGGSPPPYGYRVAEDGQMLEPLPEERTVIERVRRWRSRGWSLRRIASRLTSDGTPTKAGQPVWHPQQVSRLLRDGGSPELDS